MHNTKEKYNLNDKINYRLWHDSKGNYRDYRDWKPNAPVIPINAEEMLHISRVSDTLSNLPTYTELEQQALEQNTIVDISDYLSFLEDNIAFLENDTIPIRKPEDKPSTNGPAYYRPNWRLRVGTADDIIKRLEMGFAISMGLCERFGDTIRQGLLWYGAFGISLDCDEFYDGSKTKSHRPAPCYSMDTFMSQYPNIKEFARYIIPSSRSLFEDRPFKARAWLPFEIPVFDYRVFQLIGDKLNQIFPFLPEGVTKNGVAVAFGAAHNTHLARHFEGCISRKFIEQCQQEIIDETQQRTSDEQKRQQREKVRLAHRAEQNKIRTQLKARGHEIQDTRSPIQVFIETVYPIDFMLTHGWITAVGGNDYNWHESGPGKSCEITTTENNGVVIKPFSASMQAASPNADPTDPVGGHRFILWHLYQLDINKDADKPELRKQLAEDGYGTHPDEYKQIRAAEQKAAKDEGLTEHPKTDQHINVEADQKFVQSILEDTLDIPNIEVKETPAYQYWTPEQRIICEKMLFRDPDEGWHIAPTGVWIPAFTTKFSHLHHMTNLDCFKMNGQPPEILKNRIFATQPTICPKCHYTAALSIDRNRLTTHNWCPKCHTDRKTGSYLDYELNRKVENAVISKYQGFLGDNPDFQHWEVFRSGLLTYLGAAMATGKTTEIVKAIIQRVITENKRGIICVPRVSLARAIAHVFRRQHGHNAWGLWHEGSGHNNQFIGTMGAIVCLPSLANAVSEAEEQGFGINDLLIAIDELDFSYQLLGLDIAQKGRIRNILQETVKHNGLVVAGQTEFTLALEAFAAELGLETSDIHGFYNTAEKADGKVEIRHYPDVEGKTDLARTEMVEKIRNILQAGKNAYVFCHQRRDVAMLAEIFAAENPVLYTAYHKGDPRADKVLRNQKVTDTKLFLATSSAGVGINIHDPNAETVMLAGPLYGQRDIAMKTQEKLRNRDRTDVTSFLPHLATPLPIAPSETEAVSLYEQGLKILDTDKYKNLPEASIKRLARTKALATLADADPMTFFKHHIENVAGMKIIETQAEIETIDQVQTIKEIRAKTRQDEQEAVTERILEIINAPKLQIMTSNQIRAQGAAGKLIPMPIEQLAQERLNQAAQALGWDDTETTDFSFIDKALLKELILTIRDIRELRQQGKGWTAVHHNEAIHQQFEQHMMQNQHTEGLTAEEGALEITDIEDHRLRGALLTELLNTLIGNIYTENSLSDTVKNMLNKRYGHERYLTLIQKGGLGVDRYRATRFLHFMDDGGIVNWIRDFISKWYPVRIAKHGENYYLTPQDNAHLKIQVFQAGYKGKNPDDDSNPPPFIDGFCEPPDPFAKAKAEVRQIVTDGQTPKEAAEKTGLHYETVLKLTKDIRDQKKVKQIEQALQLREEGNSFESIGEKLKVNKATVSRWDKAHVQSHIVAKTNSEFQLSTRNCKTELVFATNVTLQNQILGTLATGEKSTSEIIDEVDGQPTSVKNLLKALRDDGQIIKMKHGVYAHPEVPEEIAQAKQVTDTQVSDPIPAPVSEPEPVSLPEEPEQHVQPDTEQHLERTPDELWYAVYLIQNILLDRRMYSPAEIAEQTQLSKECCDQALRFMYKNVLLNPGVGDQVWMDTDAAGRCWDYVLSSTSSPSLVKAHLSLSATLECQKLIDYWMGNRMEMIDQAMTEGVTVPDWQEVFAWADTQVAPLKEKMKTLKEIATQYSQQAYTEVQAQRNKTPT